MSPRSASILAFALAMIALDGCAALASLNVLAPDDVPGITCLDGQLCLEDPRREAEARALYQEAQTFVSALPGGLQTGPRIVFCSSMDCFRRFGFDNSAAATVGNLGIVISPRGWKDYYLRHELIHHQQSEQFGMLKQWLMPEWFKEGMAYALSQDPRPVLARPFQQYRQRFLDWQSGIDPSRFWQEAEKL